MLYKKYEFGDTAVHYVQTDWGIGLSLYPANVEIGDADALCCDSMVQVSLRGDYNLADYTQGVTMRNRSSVILQIVSQKKEGNK